MATDLNLLPPLELNYRFVISNQNVFVAPGPEMVDNVTHFIVIRFYSDSGFVNVWDNIQNILN